MNKLLKYLAVYKCYEILMLRFNSPKFPPGLILSIEL